MKLFGKKQEAKKPEAEENAAAARNEWESLTEAADAALASVEAEAAAYVEPDETEMEAGEGAAKSDGTEAGAGAGAVMSDETETEASAGTVSGESTDAAGDETSQADAAEQPKKGLKVLWEKLFARTAPAEGSVDPTMAVAEQTEETEDVLAKPPKTILNVSAKILMLCQIPMIVVCVLVVLVGSSALRTSIESEIENSVRIVAASVSETYTNLYEGDYKQDQSGKVKKGDTKISGETDLIDGLYEQTGFDISFVYGNGRLITTLKKPEGGRINGTKLPEEIYEQVKLGEGFFVRDYMIDSAQTNYYIYYLPLINSDGTIVGAIEAATPSASVQETINAKLLQLILISVLCVIVAAVLVTIISRSMVKTMKKTREFLSHLQEGELDAVPDAKQLKRRDELGEVYRISVALQQTLHGIVTDIKESADHLTQSANELTQMAQSTEESVNTVYISVEEISETARSQAEETADANTNVARIGEQIDYIAEEVKSLTEYAGHMADAEKESEQIIQELNGKTEETKETVLRVSDQIKAMNAAVSSITKAAGMIQDIADETDLLSLNASIEAARAGDAGRGFAVVAEQISKLADQSKRSAGEIEHIISEITQSSERMVGIMGDVETSMNEQQGKLEETRVKYSAVADGVENSLQHIEGIRHKMDVLGESGDAIREVIEGLSAISAENAASADNTMHSARGVGDTMTELKQASEKLLKMAGRLEKRLGRFRV